MILWHRTTTAAAEDVLRDGFRDGWGGYMTDDEREGVWLSDRPLDANEGACGDALLRVDLTCTEAEIADYEWIENDKTYREWLVPASFVNVHAKVSLAEPEADPARRGE
jgi:hypothetical protein